MSERPPHEPPGEAPPDEPHPDDVESAAGVTDPPGSEDPGPGSPWWRPIRPTPNGTIASDRIRAARTRDWTIAKVRPRISSSISVPSRVNPAR